MKKRFYTFIYKTLMKIHNRYSHHRISNIPSVPPGDFRPYDAKDE